MEEQLQPLGQSLRPHPAPVTTTYQVSFAANMPAYTPARFTVDIQNKFSKTVIQCIGLNPNGTDLGRVAYTNIKAATRRRLLATGVSFTTTVNLDSAAAAAQAKTVITTDALMKFGTDNGLTTTGMSMTKPGQGTSAATSSPKAPFLTVLFIGITSVIFAHFC